MTLLAPLSLLGALLGIPIILLYMLRLRRREVVVSSNFLWQQIIQDREANAPWQRLRRNLLLLLQLLILALLVLALARPAQIVPTISAGRTVILLDASASMNATDIDGGTRFQQAQAEARLIIGERGIDDDISIIRVGEQAEPLVNYTEDINVMRNAVNAAQPGNGAGDWQTALTLAAAGAEGSEDFSMIIISDGGIPDDTQLPENIPQPNYIPVGNSGDNLALTALATRALPGQAPQLFTQVQNDTAQDAEVSLVIRLDGALWESETRTVSANSQRSFVFEVDDAFETIEAEISSDDVTDYLPLDNRAYAVSSGSSTRRILLVSAAPNIFIEQVLRSLPGVEVFRGNADDSTLPGQDFDLYIFNQYLPTTLPNADMLIFDPPRSTPLFALGEAVEGAGELRLSNPAHPLAAFLNVENINVRAYDRVSATGWAELIIVVGDDPLLLAGDTGGRQVLLLPFALTDSDLPLQIAFPLLMSNALEWFAPTAILGGNAALDVGETVRITPPLDADEVRVTLPDGSTETLFVSSDAALTFAQTTEPGLYTLDVLAEDDIIETQPFAVNLFGSGESDIAPRESINVGGGAVTGAEDDQLGFHEWWQGLAILALCILLLEWYLYFRRLRVPDTVNAEVTRTTARR